MNKRELFLTKLGFVGYCEVPARSKHPYFVFITRSGYEIQLCLRRNIEKSIYTYSVLVFNPNGYYDSGLSDISTRITEDDYKILRDG